MANYSKYSDLELAALLKDDDRLAFTEIYERYSGLLSVYAFKLTADRDAAKDIIQELFTTLWDNRLAIHFKFSLLSYLYTAVRHKFLKEIAHQKVKTGYAERFLISMEKGVSSTEAYLDEKELIRTIERLVVALPPKMARAFILSKLEFRSYAEIAEELNISEKTVQNLISQASTQLKPKMGLSILAVLLIP